MGKVIAIADDEQAMREMIASYLHNEGFTTIEARNGSEAITCIKKKSCDFLLLDVMMPEMDGLSALREIRTIDKNIPVIMLTAKAEEIDKLLGLELGADDYITKPFSLRELAARMKAVWRRIDGANAIQNREEEEIIERGDIMINCANYEVYAYGKKLSLTPTEYKILLTLAEKPGRVFSRLQLMNHAMGEAYVNYERSIDTHVSNLRKKLEKDPTVPKYIHTVYGIGYRFGEKK